VGLYHVEWQRIALGSVSLPVPSWPIVQPWVVPMLAWTAFLTVMLFTSLCLVTLVRRRWVEEERLSFPLVLLPLLMTEPGEPIRHNTVFWWGFALAAGVELVNGVHTLLPLVPELPLRVEIPDAEGTRTLIKTGLFPFVLGLAFFMPLEMLLSLWLFAALGTSMRLLGTGSAETTWYGPYLLPSGQLFGRYLAVALFALAPFLRRRPTTDHRPP